MNLFSIFYGFVHESLLAIFKCEVVTNGIKNKCFRRETSKKTTQLVQSLIASQLTPRYLNFLKANNFQSFSKTSKAKEMWKSLLK